MAAVTITFIKQLGFGESGKRLRVVADAVFSATTYSNGLALPGSSLGMPNVVEELEFVQSSPTDSNIYKWDAVNQKIRIYNSVSGTEVSGNQTITIRVGAMGW